MINFKIAKPSKVQQFRQKWNKKGYELINITTLLEPKMGESGWCNGFNEPDDTIHHIQLYYRNEIVANLGDHIEIIDDKKYCVFIVDPVDNDFIIFRKVKL